MYSEAHLVDQLRRGATNWLQIPERRLTVRREVVVGRSIADLVVFVRDKSDRAVRKPLTIEECVILASLRLHGSTRIDVLEHRCGLERTRLRQGALARLSEWGILGRSNGGRVAILRSVAGRGRVIAIEAKLLKWRDSIRQAETYRQYADTAFVALPEEIVQRNSISKEAFREVGIGLLSVSPGSVVQVVRPSRSNDHDWRREYVLSRMLCNV